MQKKLLTDGIVKICSVGNVAQPGDTPKDGLTLCNTMRFAWKTVGASRFYEAMQAQVKLDKLILVLCGPNISPKDIAVIGNEQYKIVQVQRLTGEKPEQLQLSLEKLEAEYDSNGVS